MTENSPKIRVVVVDDNADTINNLKKLLYFEKDVEIVGTASSGEEGIARAIEKLPDVVLMDINMPGMDGISASEAITARMPGVQIVIMSVQAEADYLRRAMLAGAREFLIKPFSSEQLANTLRAVYQLSVNTRPAAEKPPALVAATAPTMGPREPLTPSTEWKPPQGIPRSVNRPSASLIAEIDGRRANTPSTRSPVGVSTVLGGWR